MSFGVNSSSAVLRIFLVFTELTEFELFDGFLSVFSVSFFADFEFVSVFLGLSSEETEVAFFFLDFFFDFLFLFFLVLASDDELDAFLFFYLDLDFFFDLESFFFLVFFWTFELSADSETDTEEDE